MDDRSKNFEIILKSNDSMRNYPGNVISHFVNQFVKTVRFPGEWVCALTRVGYHRTWLNITERQGVEIEIQLELRASLARRRLPDTIYVTRIIPEGSYTSPDAIIQMLYAIGEYISDGSGKVYRLKEMLNITFDKERDRFAFRVIGKDMNAIHFSVNNTKGGLQLKKLLGMSAERASFRIQRRRALILCKPADLSKHIDNLWIYAPNLINPMQIGNHHKPLLAIIPVNHTDQQGAYIHYNIQNPMYLKLTQSAINSIEILVTDSNGQKIPFDDYSGPFVLSIDFKHVNQEIEHISMTHDNDEYFYIISDKCMDMYPDNSSAQFTNNLATPYELNGEWEVALCSLRYQKSWKQLTNDQTISVTISCAGNCRVQTFAIKFPADFYYQPEDLVRIWNKTWLRFEIPVTPAKGKPKRVAPFSISSAGLTQESSDEEAEGVQFKTTVIQLGQLVELIYMKATRKYYFMLKTNVKTTPVRAEIDFLPTGTTPITQRELLNLFGIILQPDDEDNDVIDRQSHILTLMRGEQSAFLHASPDFQDNTFNLWITSSIVESTITGESSLPLLNIVPVKGQTNDYIFHTYTQRQYITVTQSGLQDISIQIVDSAHNIVQFHSNKPTIALLHFRKKSSD